MAEPQVLRSVQALRAQVKAWRVAGDRIALVPTMGALHDGHLSLVELAQGRAERVVVSIFVNPKQFGPGEDFTRYPRQEAADRARLGETNADLLFAPPVEEIYPPDFASSVRVAGLGDRLEGAHRPGHFDGVTTVVAKLLLQALPDIAVFGEKDYQQLQIIRRMARDLDIPVEIVGAPLMRDGDGLALSSRNVYLSAAERRIALALPWTLKQLAEDLADGEAAAPRLAAAAHKLLEAGFQKVDYVELIDADSLAPLDRIDPSGRAARVLAAAFVGSTRLIDNMPVALTA